MDRKSLRQHTHNVGNVLSIQKTTYKQWVFRYTFLELEKDLGDLGDITSNPLFGEDLQATGRVYAREAGVLAGKEEVEYFLVGSDPDFKPSLSGKFDLKFLKDDGEEFEGDEILLELSGKVRDLLAVERVYLNLLMRMSGVATYTKKVLDLVKDYDVLVTPTRKTIWGLLDRKAVYVAGGGTHRLNLSDSVIVKDTHSRLLGHDFDRIVKSYSEAGLDCRFIEIEVNSKEHALETAKAFNKYELSAVPALLLDNMTPEGVKECVDAVRAEKKFEGILLEASGGITDKNVVDYAKTGVDIVSLGALTNGPRSLNMSFKIE